MALNHLQQRLEQIYEVQLEHRVEDFLFSDPRLRDALEPNGHGTREQLLVHEDGEGLSMSLYVEPEVLEALTGSDPLAPPEAGNLDAWCVALEGVSHFLYLAYKAGHDRCVSLLELELQAEVDKYVLLLCALAERHHGRVPASLRQRLFGAVRFDPRLDAVAAGRYRDANDYAARFCADIEQRYARARDFGSMLRDLRRFYRLDQGGKLRRIDRGVH